MTERTTADHLAAVIAAWDSFYDNASGWQERVDEAVYFAKEHLAPRLLEVEDPAPAPRCLP